jgi:hypothetical protein
METKTATVHCIIITPHGRARVWMDRVACAVIRGRALIESCTYVPIGTAHVLYVRYETLFFTVGIWLHLILSFFREKEKTQTMR